MTKSFISGCLYSSFLLAVFHYDVIPFFFEAFTRPLAKLACEKMGQHFHTGSLLHMWSSDQVLRLSWSGLSFFHTPFTWTYVNFQEIPSLTRFIPCIQVCVCCTVLNCWTVRTLLRRQTDPHANQTRNHLGLYWFTSA